MNNHMLALRRIGAMLMAMSMLMIVIGIADAQAPNKLCADATKSGCVGEDCTTTTGECASKTNYDGQERSSYPYKECNGAAGACEGWEEDFLVCQNRFYYREMQKTCATHACTLNTTIKNACAN